MTEYDDKPQRRYGLFPRDKCKHNAWYIAPVNITIKSCTRSDKKLKGADDE